MTEDNPRDVTDAPERYELESEPFPHDSLLPVDLFALYGPGLVVLTDEVWLHVGETGGVTVCAGKAEVGQNARTSLAQAAADELRVPLDLVRTVLGDTDRTPFDMGTFGSRTTPFTVPSVRRAAAQARETLSVLAAADGRPAQADYGSLVRGQRLVRTAGPNIAPTPTAHWTAAGLNAPKANGRAFVTGQHRYASDVVADRMVFGKVLRPPAFGATLRTANTSLAESLPGVTVVRDGGFVGVTAPTPREAERALAAVDAAWETPPQPRGQDLAALLRPEPTAFDPPPNDTAHALQATYTLPFIAHVPLETRAALAQWDSGKLTVWTGTQRPFGVREELSVAFGLSDQNVRVIVPDTGSGYGGKHTGEAAIEAARLARTVGRPVKIVWTREEEFTAAYFRPGGVIDVSAAVRADGTLTGWQFHNYNSGAAGIQAPYAVPEQRAEFHEVTSPLRQGSYRALAATGNHFARECHMDDLARACQMDPLAFRLANLNDDRLRTVLEAAADRFGWHTRHKTAGHGFGMACGTEKGSVIANCVEVAVDGTSGEVTIRRIVAAFECGAVINPRHLVNQVEGAIVMGIGGALFEQIDFDGGRVLNPRLSEYRVPRFQDTPEIEVMLLDRKNQPSVGAGETPIVAIAPAIGNAICDATGVRLRSLPLVLQKPSA